MKFTEWLTYPKPSSQWIVQASRKDGTDEMQPFPIGFSYSIAKAPFCIHGSHESLVLCAISDWTDQNRRPSAPNRKSFLETLKQNGICNQVMTPESYFATLSSYKFVISPEGNGVDTHRTYEALIAGCIPIVEDHLHIREKYQGCPILWTSDYSEITPAYLEEKWREFQNQDVDCSCLFLSHYPRSVQKEIRDCGNYWMKRCTEKYWYPILFL